MKYRVFAVGVSIFWMASAALAGTVQTGDYSTIQERLGIPTSVGSVVDVSGKNPQVILIQDVHRHPEAQEHIRTMILSAMTRMGAKEIFLEGAWTHGQTADYAFLGLEDPDIYRQNVAAYEAVEKVRDEALRELETARIFSSALDADSAEQWPQIKRLIQLRLKPAEYADYMKNPYRTTENTALAGAVSSAEHFYALANERSRIFLEKAQTLHRSGTQVLVVGGFHTKAMAEELKRKGISYVVLSPHMTQGGFEKLYADGMHETVSALKLR